MGDGGVSDNGGSPQTTNYLTKETFLEIIKSPEFVQIITAAVEQLVKRIDNLETQLDKTNKIERQSIEISKLKKDVNSLSKASDVQKSVYTQQLWIFAYKDTTQNDSVALLTGELKVNVSIFMFANAN